jgi:hypothetical protein
MAGLAEQIIGQTSKLVLAVAEARSLFPVPGKRTGSGITTIVFVGEAVPTFSVKALVTVFLPVYGR